MIERTIFREEHHIFRESVRRFVDREIVPFHAQWEKDGIVPRNCGSRPAAEGLLCCTYPRHMAAWASTICSTWSCSRNCGAPAPAGPGF